MRVYLYLAGLLVLIPGHFLGPQSSSGDEPAKPKSRTPGLVAVRLRDTSNLRMTLKEEAVTLATRHGKLRIPVADIVQIDFATRVAPEAARQIDAAIADLGSKEFAVRQAASEKLEALGVVPYHALVEAAKGTDPEVARRANELIEKIKETFDDEALEFRPADVLQLADGSKYTGQIEGTEFRAHTDAFGELPLKIHGVHSLRSVGREPEINLARLPEAPPHLANFGQMIGKVLVFRATGINNAVIYGTDVYTSDSNPAMAAVHAGILKVGETGRIKVTIVVPPPNYVSTTRHGVTSQAYGAYNAAYKVHR